MNGAAATRSQHAVRLLTLLSVCGNPVGGNDPPGAVQVIRSEKRLQALDFWLRNPDYLADQLVRAVKNGAIGSIYVDVAESLLTDPEPAWHHFPMPKWFYGAYESVDDAFALLQAYGLGMVRRRGAPPKRLQNQFFLTELGSQKADELNSSHGLDWYPRQARLVQLVAGNDSGTRLKDRQYEQEAYAKAMWGDDIGSIGDQVKAQILGLRASTSGGTISQEDRATQESLAGQGTQTGSAVAGVAGIREEEV